MVYIGYYPVPQGALVARHICLTQGHEIVVKAMFSSKVPFKANKAHSTLKLNPKLTNVDAHGNISRYTISVIAWVPLKYTDLALKVSHMAFLN